VRVARSTMYGLVDKTYIGEPTTTSSLQSQDFVDTLIVINTRRVDGVERKSLNTKQCQERCINTLSQRLCFLLSENLTEKVILNLTDCDSCQIMSLPRQLIRKLFL
jgi:hypothetical protein